MPGLHLATAHAHTAPAFLFSTGEMFALVIGIALGSYLGMIAIPAVLLLYLAVNAHAAVPVIAVTGSGGVVLLILAFAAGHLHGGPTILRHLGSVEYQTRLGNVRRNFARWRWSPFG